MYGLIGKKISHSFSADFFNKKFANEGINESYNLFPLPSIEELTALLDLHPDLKGLNVTIPYKEQVIPFLDDLSDEAKGMGAVNVIKITYENGKRHLKGFNSDAIGFKESVIPLLNDKIKKALVLGTGGASKAVAFVLKSLGIEVLFVSRTPDKSQISYEDLTPEIIKDHLLIVNTTPLGMFPEINASPSIPYHLLTPQHICYDVIYNPSETEFLKKAASMGATVKNGLEMLRLQAIGAWEIWNS